VVDRSSQDINAGVGPLGEHQQVPELLRKLITAHERGGNVPEGPSCTDNDILAHCRPEMGLTHCVCSAPTSSIASTVSPSASRSRRVEAAGACSAVSQNGAA